MKLIILLVCSWIAFSEEFLFRNKESYGLNNVLFKSLEFQGSGYATDSADLNYIKKKIFTQKLDHFNPTDQTVWSQNYWQNERHYVHNGPVFLAIGGEGPESAQTLAFSSWSTYATKYKALLFLLEHRFYGESKPFNILGAGNLTHLNSEQALADLAYFIEAMNREHHFPGNTKWIVFGASYSATLAAWMRIKYPHLVYAAYSTSAPLVAKANFREYFQVVRDTLASYKKECVSAIIEANTELDKKIRTKKGRKEVQKIFNLCYELKGNKNISLFFSYFAESFADAVQYNHPRYRPRVKMLCNIMVNAKETLMTRYRQVLAYPETECIPVSYEKSIEYFLRSNNFMKAWYYQTCTEFGWYQTSGKRTDLFSRHLSLPFFTAFCKDVYGSRFDVKLLSSGIQRTNIFFGGGNVKVGRILFVHGSADPWHPLGIFKSSSDQPYDAVFIKNASHCADYYQASQYDTPEMVEARKEIDKVMKSWLS